MKLFKKIFKRVVRDNQRGAYDGVVDDLFQNYFEQRHKIYYVNFVRGIFFGLGSVIGGTVVLAFVIWVTSFFVNFPVIGELIHQANENLKAQHQTK